jgi:hypothetical protein
MQPRGGLCNHRFFQPEFSTVGNSHRDGFLVTGVLGPPPQLRTIRNYNEGGMKTCYDEKTLQDQCVSGRAWPRPAPEGLVLLPRTIRGGYPGWTMETALRALEPNGLAGRVSCGSEQPLGPHTNRRVERWLRLAKDGPAKNALIGDFTVSEFARHMSTTEEIVRLWLRLGVPIESAAHAEEWVDLV